MRLAPRNVKPRGGGAKGAEERAGAESARLGPMKNSALAACLLALFAFAPLAVAQEKNQDIYDRERAAMAALIEDYGRTATGLAGEDGISGSVLAAMRETPRHLFVPERYRSLAYADRPVPIGHGQTISQPFVVAVMTELAAPRAEHSVLEIGTGSGYQAAILARLVRKVCTIEIVRPLGERAAALLKELGHGNVEVRIGDGYKGWQACGPFDAVIVTAALDHVPQPLIDQLKQGGRLVMPVGPQGRVQQLTVLEKTRDGELETRELGPVRFVPFVRERE